MRETRESHLYIFFLRKKKKGVSHIVSEKQEYEASENEDELESSTRFPIFRIDTSPGSSATSKVQNVSDGNSTVEELEANHWPNSIPFLFEFVDERISARLVFIYEHNRALTHYAELIEEARLTRDFKKVERLEKEKKAALNGLQRDHATHPHLTDTEAYPYILLKFNDDFRENTTNLPAGENFRYVLAVRDRYDKFLVKVPTVKSYQIEDGRTVVSTDGPLVVWDDPRENHDGIPIRYHFQISKLMYEMRNELEIKPPFIDRFINDEVRGPEIFVQVKTLFRRLVDIGEEWCTLLALWVMGTHVHRMFYAFPYAYLFAAQGSGKTVILKVASKLAHNGELVLDPSSSSIFRLVDKTSCTLCIDEADKLDPLKNREFVGIVNAGYESGHSIIRTNMDLNCVERFKAYSPKMLASNRALDTTLVSRCIRIPIVRTPNEMPDPITQANIETFAYLKQEMEIWAVDTASKLYQINSDATMKKFKERFKGTPPRLTQIMKPLLIIYDMLGLDDYTSGAVKMSETANLNKIINYLVQESQVQTLPDADFKFLVALYQAARSDARFITSREIMDYMGTEGLPEKIKREMAARLGGMVTKYNIPRHKTSLIHYFKEKDQSDWDRTKRTDFMIALLARYSIDSKELDASLNEESDQKRIESGEDEVPYLNDRHGHFINHGNSALAADDGDE